MINVPRAVTDSGIVPHAARVIAKQTVVTLATKKKLTLETLTIAWML